MKCRKHNPITLPKQIFLSRKAVKGRHLRADSLSLLLSALRPRLLIVTFFGAILVGLSSFSDENVSAASISLSVPSEPLTLSINPASGTTFTKSEASVIKVKTDAFRGYTLSLKVKNSENSNNLLNGDAKLKSIASELSEEEFQASGETNSWGYLPSKLNSSENAKFQSGPTELATLDETSEKNDTDNSYNISLAAKVDGTVATGNYASTFVLSATANAVPYSITYNLGSGTGGPSPNPQTGSTTDETVKLSSETPTQSGYEFKGWCTVSTSDESCSGTTYQAGADYSLSDGTSITLYAMWQSSGRRYTITYSSNVGSPSSMPSQQTGTATASNSYNVNISSTTPTLSGYNFMGWCSTSTSSESCSGTTYQPGNSWTVSSDNAALSLYAMWEETGPGSCPKPITSCSNGSYSGKRFGGGRCWMSSDFKSGVQWSSSFGCPSGWSTPTQSDFKDLLSSSQAGFSACLYEQGWSGYYWSSTMNHSYGYYALGVLSSMAYIDTYFATDRYNIRCVSS